MPEKSKSALEPKPWWIATSLGLASFALYCFTLHPSIGPIDCGELIASIYEPGIPHATGYPLFALTGYLFTHLPLPFSVAVKANLFSALCGAAAVSIFFLFLNFLLTRFYPVSTKLRLWAAMGGALLLASNLNFWNQATAIEVYSLHCLLVISALWAVMKAWQDNTDRDWYVAVALVALSFGNHMTTILLAPFWLWFSIAKRGLGKSGLLFGLKLGGIFVGVFGLLYSYLPIRAGMNPMINWGNPQTWEAIKYHVLGKQYSVWVFSSSAVTKRQLGHFFSTLPEFSGYLGLILGILGLYLIYQTSRKLFWPLLPALFWAIFFPSNYDITDIDSYFLLAHILICAFGTWAILWALEKREQLGMAAILPGLLVAGINFKKADQRDQHFIEDNTLNTLNSAQPNALIISKLWDTWLAASYYYQLVEGVRKDVMVIDRELLRRTWYYNQLETQHPELLRPIEEEVKRFKMLLVPFEKDEPFNSQALESTYREITNQLIAKHVAAGKPVYLTAEFVDGELANGEISLPAGYTLLPEGQLLRVASQSIAYLPFDYSKLREVRLSKVENRYSQQVKSICFNHLVWRSTYEIAKGKPELCKPLVAQIVKLGKKQDLPENLLPYLQR